MFIFNLCCSFNQYFISVSPISESLSSHTESIIPGADPSPPSGFKNQIDRVAQLKFSEKTHETLSSESSDRQKVFVIRHSDLCDFESIGNEAFNGQGPGKITYFQINPESGEKEVHRIEEGVFVDAKLHGEGVITWPNYRKQEPNSKCQTYTGKFVNGDLHIGEKFYLDATTNNGIFEIEHKDKDCNGMLAQGVLKYPNNGGKAGYFIDGILGKGIYVEGFQQSCAIGQFNNMEELIEGKLITQEGITKIYKDSIIISTRNSTLEEMQTLRDPNLLDSWENFIYNSSC